MKFSTVADKEYQKTLDEPDKTSSGDRYFRPNQLDNNQEIEFIVLEEDPIEYWQAFGKVLQMDQQNHFVFLLQQNLQQTKKFLKEWVDYSGVQNASMTIQN